MNDLFGTPILEATMPIRPALRKKYKPNRQGYAAFVGSGPIGEFCSTCKHAARFGRYAKCRLRYSTWTNGYGTDILLSSPACKHWEQKQ